MRAFARFLGAALVGVLSGQAAIAGTNVTGPSAPTVYSSGAKVSAPGISYRPGWTSANVPEAADLNNVESFLQDLRVAARGKEFNLRHDYGGGAAACDGSADDTDEITAVFTAVAAAGGGLVFVPEGDCKIAVGSSISVPSNTRIYGKGQKSRIFKPSGTVTAPTFSVNGKTNIVFSDLSIDRTIPGGGGAYGDIQIEGASSNITIARLSSTLTYSGVWVRQGTRIKIVDSFFSSSSHPIYLGGNNALMGGAVSEVIITGNHIHDAITGGDGIKLVKQASDVVIAGNIIEDNAQDAIDLFASGEKVLIANNILRRNGVVGIDIKADQTNYPYASWGKGRDITIVGNLIAENDESGVKIWKEDDGDFPFNVTVATNQIYGNGFYGVVTRAPNTVISNNTVRDNGTETGSSYAGIYVLGSTSEHVKGGVIAGNLVQNNGSVSTTTYGINLQDADGIGVHGNAVDNVDWLKNPGGTANNTQEGGINVGASCRNLRFTGNIIGAAGTVSTPWNIATGATYEALGNYPNTEDRILARNFVNAGTSFTNELDQSHFLSVSAGLTTDQIKGILWRTRLGVEQARMQVSAAGTLLLSTNSIAALSQLPAGDLTIGAPGEPTELVGNVYVGSIASGPRLVSGSGAPESSVTAPVGSIYLRTGGGAGTAFCVKESGSGNTGWACK